MQCGGWSLRWQGFNGNDLWSGQNKVSSNASSIFDAFTSFKNSASAKVLILLLSSLCYIQTTVQQLIRLPLQMKEILI